MKQNSQSILITGLSGFVGSNLYKYLLKGSVNYTITGATRRKHTLSARMRNLTESIHTEELFSNTKKGYEIYIHLAGKAHDLKNTSDDAEYFKVNYELTKKLFDRFLADEKSRTFIFISSVKAVADEVDGELTEDHHPKPVTAYGQSKLKAEQYILENTPADKKVVILRPCMIHGPGNKGNLNLLYQLVSRGIPYPLGAFENRRSFLSVENLCFVIHEILSGQLQSGVYNVADDESLSTVELVEILAETVGRKPGIWSVPKSMINLIAKAGNFLPIPLNEERLQKLTENYIVSNNKLTLALSKELPVSARDGLSKTFSSFN